MFRTDASLKGVSRRGPATNTRGSSSFTGASSAGGGQALAPSGREAAVEQARLEREAREHKRRATSHAVRMQARARRRIAQRHLARNTRAALAQQLDDVANVTAALGAVGLPFVPPAATAHALMRSLLCIWAKGTPPLEATDSGLLSRLLSLVVLPSLRSQESVSNLASTEAFEAAGQPKLTQDATPGKANTTTAAMPEALAVKLRLRRLVSACLDLAAAAIADGCTNVTSNGGATSGKSVSLPPICEQGAKDALACLECLVIGVGSSGAIGAEARSACTETLQHQLVNCGRLRQVLLSLPEPRAVACDRGGGSASGASGGDQHWCGGCSVPAASRARVHALMGAFWRLTMHCIQPAHTLSPSSPFNSSRCLPPSTSTLASFAVQLLTVPLLFWRQDGKNYGRLVLGANSFNRDPDSSSTTAAASGGSTNGGAGSSSGNTETGALLSDALGVPTLWYPLLHALAAALNRAREHGQPLTQILPPGVASHPTVSSDHWLLGNLVVLGRRSCFTYGTPGCDDSTPLSPSISSAVATNGETLSQNPEPLSFAARRRSVLDGSVLLDLLAMLLEHAPLGLLSDTAAVTWSTQGVSHTPVTLPPPLVVQVRSLVEGRSAGTFLDSLAFAALGPSSGVASLVQGLSARSKEDEADEASLRESDASGGGAAGGALSAADLAFADAKRKHRSGGWLDSTWAHRLALSSSNAARAASEAFTGFFNTTSCSSSSGGSNSGNGRGSISGGHNNRIEDGSQLPALSPLRSANEGLMNVSHTARAAAHGDLVGGPGGGVAGALAAQSASSDAWKSSHSSPGMSTSSSSSFQMSAATDDLANISDNFGSLSVSPSVAAGVAVRPLARFLAVLFRRWLNPNTKGLPPSRATSNTPLVFWLLHSLALSSVVKGRPDLVQGLWAYLQHAHPKPASSSSSGAGGGLFSGSSSSTSSAGADGSEDIGSDGGSGSVCAVLCFLMSQLLVVLDDSELLEKPLEAHQLRRFVKWHKDRLFALVWTDYDKQSPASAASTTSSGAAAAAVGARNGSDLSEQQAFLRASVAKCVRDLYDRSSRRPFLAPPAWLVAALSQGGRALAEVQGATPRGSRLLHAMPYCLPFAERLRLFQQRVATDKAATQPSGAPGLRVRIRRARVLEDGLRELNNRGRDLRRRLYVEFVNEYGAAESGVDAGGLFKEFWTDLSALAFNMDFGLFRVTPTGGMLYPSPAAASLQGERESLELFAFLGRVLGKALYEGLTVEPKFAHFFLAHLRGPYNYLNTWHDLSTLDSELHKNLMFLKTYNGDAADLCLTFTVADDSGFGSPGAQIDLIPGGSTIEVTNRNKLEYIERVSNHLLVKRLRPQSDAFKRGLSEVIDLEHLAMFNEAELQVLISGAPTAIDVVDLKQHCRLAGGFTSMDRTVQRFWKVVASLDAREQALLLRFVTSCQRPPPLGFEQLQPPFCLQRISVSSDDEKLPSAATCFNTLKLPTYSSEKVMKKKLLVSITSNSGFELT